MAPASAAMAPEAAAGTGPMTGRRYVASLKDDREVWIDGARADDVTAHPLQVSIDIASLAPNAEITVFPWKEPPELKARTINRARKFLKRYQRA